MGSSKSKRPVVLVVDDEPLILMNAVCIVQDAGFEVLEASNADEAILVLERRQDIRIVFTDVDMPGTMDGLRLAAAVRNRWPPVQFLVTSGCAIVTSDLMPSGSRFLPKPYSPAHITAALRELVEGRG